jgi:hypothetical protein
MRILSVIMVIAAAVLAFPFGWGLGVIAAYAIAGEEFGQLPVGTVPVSIAGSLVFALMPSIAPPIRLAVMAAGTLLFVALAKIGWPI